MITKPIQWRYATQPYEHQEKIFRESRERSEFALFWEMGTGKSKVIIDTATWLFVAGEIDGVLILSDKGSYMGWYHDEIDKHLPLMFPSRRAYWSSSMRSKDRKPLEEILVAQDDALDFLCMNIEAINSERAYAIAERFIRSHYCMMVIDESTSIKNPKAERTKRAIELGQLTDYRRICSGTPITQSPLDMFGMSQFLRHNILGFASFTSFKVHYCIFDLIYISGGRQIQVVSGHKNLDDLHRRIQGFSSRILKTECLDLPQKVYETKYVELSAEQRRIYDDLKDRALVELDQGLLTSTAALTTINKLQQIVCGHVKLDDGTIVDLENGRMQLLIELLETIDEKVVIWCAFQRDVELILEAIRVWRKDAKDSLYGVHYYGKTSEADRAKALANFEKDHDCRWWVGTAATGGKGINQLVAARYGIYYSNTYNLEDRLQSEDRLHRIGQLRSVTYFDIIAHGTVDEKVLVALHDKRDLAHQVLDRFRELID